MKIYLHGGFDIHEYDRTKLFDQLRLIFDKEHITEVLHIPFARAGVRNIDEDWYPGRFSSVFPDITFFDAKYKQHIAQVDPAKVFVLITGGSGGKYLLETIKNYAPLEEIVRNAPYIFGSSAGMKCLGTKYHNNGEYYEGLGLINYIGEGHFTQKERKETVEQHLQSFDVAFSLGVDKDTIIEREDGVIGETWGEGESFIVMK